jgi:hypothetical protein
MTGRALGLLSMAVLAMAAAAQAQNLRDMSDADLVARLRAAGRAATPGALLAPVPPHGAEGGPDRCGFALAVEARERVERGGGTSVELVALLAPQAMQTSILSPSGRFRIHFDTTGVNASALLAGDTARIPGSARQYAEFVAGFCDESETVYAVQIGYDMPPPEPGADAWNIYLREFNGNEYGITKPTTTIPGGTRTYYTYIEMDNDFLGYPTKGLAGAQVTVAHEFHHMVQLGAYGLWSQDLYMHEMTSTYYEDVVYPDINDYIQYLKPFFNRTSASLFTWPGYECVLWPRMLHEKYGPLLWRDVWMLMRQGTDPLSATDHALTAQQDDIQTEFCDWQRWNYTTGYRTGLDGAQSYPDGERYPLVKPAAVTPLIGGAVTFTSSLPPLASHYFRAVDGLDTLALVVANVDKAAAVLKSQMALSFQLEVRRGETPEGFTSAGDSWSYRFTSASSSVMCARAFTPSVVVDNGIGAFPNPYHPEQDGLLRIGLSPDITVGTATLAIFTSSMALVRKLADMQVRRDDIYGSWIGWDGTTSDGSATPSGMYFYVVSAGSSTTTGKFALIRK